MVDELLCCDCEASTREKRGKTEIVRMMRVSCGHLMMRCIMGLHY